MISLAIIAILGSCLGCPAGNIIGWAVARRRDQALGTEPFNWRLIISGKLYYEWWKQHWLCGATDGLFGRCNLRTSHDGDWHQEWRQGKLWAEWRGPHPGQGCGICHKDGSVH